MKVASIMDSVEARLKAAFAMGRKAFAAGAGAIQFGVTAVWGSAKATGRRGIAVVKSVAAHGEAFVAYAYGRSVAFASAAHSLAIRGFKFADSCCVAVASGFHSALVSVVSTADNYLVRAASGIHSLAGRLLTAGDSLLVGAVAFAARNAVRGVKLARTIAVEAADIAIRFLSHSKATVATPSVETPAREVTPANMALKGTRVASTTKNIVGKATTPVVKAVATGKTGVSVTPAATKAKRPATKAVARKAAQKVVE